MIASFSKNFVFLKTSKTAGTSVEIVLSSWCSGADICSPFSSRDEETRAAFGGQAMNYKGWFGLKKFTNHMPARKVKAALPELWDRAYKFTIERHPYERVVSRAYWHISRRNGDPASEFPSQIERILKRRNYMNRHVYTINGAIVVDEVIVYDNLWPRLSELAQRFGTAMPTEKPKAKGGHRIDRRPARDILTQRQKDMIFEVARQDFEDFGFKR